MHPLRALIVDRDEDFADRVLRCLREAGLEADAADGRRATLEIVAEKHPAILFIAVEQPRRSGFALFSDVKRLDRQARIVLVTSTVPMTDMLLHQKLRIHADAYLDKRQLDERAVLATLDRLLGLGFDSAELGRMARAAASGKRRARPSAARPSRETTPADEDEPDAAEAEGLEPALTTLLAELGVDAPESQRARGEEDPELDAIDGEADPASADEQDVEDVHDELHERVAQLERELDIARQAARSSPFSSDYLTLAERADHGERHAARARRDADTRSRQAERLRDKLVQVAARLVESERARRAADELAEKLESRLSAADATLDQTRERLERAERDALSQSAVIEGLRREMVEAQQRGAAEALEVEARHAEALAALARRHADALDDERAQLARERQRLAQENEAGLRELSAKLGRQSLEVLETRETDWQRRLEEERRARTRGEEDLREAHRREMAELHESLEQVLARKERQLAAELLAVTDEHEQKVERETAEWQKRLDQAHRALASESVEVLEAHRRELGERDERHAAALAELRAAHAAESERLRAAHAATIQEMTGRLEARETGAHADLDAARREHERQLEALREEHERERARTSAAHEQAFAEQAHRHAEELTTAMAEMRQTRTREDAQRLAELEEADRRRRAELGEMERRYRDEIELLRKLHEVEIERLEVRQSAERDRMQAERQVALDELARNVSVSPPAPPPGRDEIRKAIEALDADPDF